MLSLAFATNERAATATERVEPVDLDLVPECAPNLLRHGETLERLHTFEHEGMRPAGQVARILRNKDAVWCGDFFQTSGYSQCRTRNRLPFPLVRLLDQRDGCGNPDTNVHVVAPNFPANTRATFDDPQACADGERCRILLTNLNREERHASISGLKLHDAGMGDYRLFRRILKRCDQFLIILYIQQGKKPGRPDKIITQRGDDPSLATIQGGARLVTRSLCRLP